jgi:Carboxypeptidase regulatory-like domain
MNSDDGRRKRLPHHVLHLLKIFAAWDDSCGASCQPADRILSGPPAAGRLFLLRLRSFVGQTLPSVNHRLRPIFTPCVGTVQEGIQKLMHPNRSRICLLTLSAALALPAVCQTFGEITGVVTDPSGAVVANATVTVTNPATNFTRKVTTNASGNYSFPALLPGLYNIRAEVEGFRAEARTGVTLEVQQTARIDFQLQVGAVAETVEVAGGAPLLKHRECQRGNRDR